jgi:hypothetical protein
VRIVENAADAERAALAASTLAACVCQDERALAAYGLWRAGHRLPDLIAELHRCPCGPHAIAVRDAILQHGPADVALLAGLIDDVAHAHPWLTDLVLRQWRTWALEDITGQQFAMAIDPRRTVQTIERAPGETAAAYRKRSARLTRAVGHLPPGRRPKNGPTHEEDLPRYVCWYYRVHLKRPKDSLAAIAREYVDNVGRAVNPSHGYVRTRINRARALLDYTCLPPTTK